MALNQNPNIDKVYKINGKKIPSIYKLLNKVKWDSISNGIPVNFHGDLQPENVIVTKDNRFKLIDWENDIWEGAPVAVGPEKVIPWYDVLGTVQKNYPDKYQEIVTLIVEYANGFGITNRDKILRSWELNPEQT